MIFFFKQKQNAVHRYLQYWNDKVKLWGRCRAYRPLTLSDCCKSRRTTTTTPAATAVTYCPFDPNFLYPDNNAAEDEEDILSEEDCTFFAHAIQKGCLQCLPEVDESQRGIVLFDKNRIARQLPPPLSPLSSQQHCNNQQNQPQKQKNQTTNYQKNKSYRRTHVSLFLELLGSVFPFQIYLLTHISFPFYAMIIIYIYTYSYVSCGTCLNNS